MCVGVGWQVRGRRSSEANDVEVAAVVVVVRCRARSRTMLGPSPSTTDRINDTTTLDDGERTPFLTTAAALATRLGGQACLIAGVGARQLAAALVAAGVDAVAEEAQPDPLTLGRLAGEAGVEAWRTGNARDGLPRPLYLRGVNITLPDGARRTVD